MLIIPPPRRILSATVRNVNWSLKEKMSLYSVILTPQLEATAAKCKARHLNALTYSVRLWHGFRELDDE